MFQFRRFPSYSYLIHCMIPYGGFPHSEISGSKLICSSPKLIAAYHVLHRLLMPRHSPCALISLTYFSLTIQEKSNIWFSRSVELCRLIVLEVFLLAKIVFYPKKFYYPLLLPSHNCINNHNVQFSRCILNSLKKFNEAMIPFITSVNLFKRSGGPKWTRTIDLTIISRVL